MRRKKRSQFLPTFIFLLIVAALIVLSPRIYDTAKHYADYHRAAEYIKSGEYEAAVSLLRELGDFRDCGDLLTQAIIGEAKQKGDSGKYADALAILDEISSAPQSQELICKYSFLYGSQLRIESQYEKALINLLHAGKYPGAQDEILLNNHDWGIALYESGEYDAAVEKLLASEAISSDTVEYIRLSYLGWGQKEYENRNYEHAIALYELSGDRSDGTVHSIDLCYYDWGHELFLAERYDEAEAKFSSMTTNQYDIGVPHFMAMSDAADYIATCALNTQDPIEFFASDVTADLSLNYSGYIAGNEYYAIGHAAQVEVGSLTLISDEKLVILSPNYYPGQRIVNAWRSGDYSDLTDIEKTLYSRASEIVSQAKAEALTPFELELWLNDWICDNVSYDSSYCGEYVGGYHETWTSVGAILNGHALCQGYVDAFYLLASLSGFEVRNQFGYTYDETNGTWGGHVWNAIELDSNWYYIDPTWNDSGEDSHAKHWYINFVTEPNHSTLDYARIAPIADCTPPELNYFSVYDLDFCDLSSAAEHASVSTGEDFAFRVAGNYSAGDFNHELVNHAIDAGLLLHWSTWYQCSGDSTLFYLHWN